MWLIGMQGDPAQAENGSGATVSDGGAGASDAGRGGGPEVAEQLGQGVDRLAASIDRFADDPSLSTAVDAFGPLLIDLGLAIVGLIVLVIVVSVLSRWARRLTERALKRLGLDDTVAHFLALVAKYAMWILAVPIAMEIFGIRATSITAAVGAAGLAIGLAMQGSLSNVASGIMLLVLRPIRIGDLVEINGEEGRVDDIGIFYTTVRLFSNESAMVPNSEVLSNKIENYSANGTRRVEVPIGVAYGSDLRKAERALLEAAREKVADRADVEPRVLLTGFGASSIDFVVFVHARAPELLTVRHQLVMAIDDALRAAEIEIPFPNRTVHLVRSKDQDDADGG